MKNKKNNKITPTGVEYIALDRLKKYLAKNELNISQVSFEDDILTKYKTFRDAIDKRTRTREEVEQMIADYLNVPVSVVRTAVRKPMDVPEGYQGVTRAYIRVSSTRESSRQDTLRQRRDLEKIGFDYIYEDYGSGMKDSRLEYNRMIRDMKTQDTILCTEISRLSRSSSSLLKLLTFIEENKMRLKAGDFEFDCRTEKVSALTKGMIQMLSVFASIERDLIAERTASGVATARANGKIVGRPSVTVDTLPDKFVDYYPMYRDQKKLGRKFNLEQIAKLCECGNRKTIGRYVQVAKAFEEETGELLEHFRERIKNEKEYEKWRREQILNSVLDIDLDTEMEE